jgi:hypothetical protein
VPLASCSPSLIVCTVGVDDGGLDCGTNAGVYEGDNLRYAWIRRVGMIKRQTASQPEEVFSLVFTGGYRYVLLKAASPRVRFRESLTEFGRLFGPIVPTSENLVPPVLQMVGDDGSPGPVLWLLGCEPAPEMPVREYEDSERMEGAVAGVVGIEVGVVSGC